MTERENIAQELLIEARQLDEHYNANAKRRAALLRRAAAALSAAPHDPAPQPDAPK